MELLSQGIMQGGGGLPVLLQARGVDERCRDDPAFYTKRLPQGHGTAHGIGDEVMPDEWVPTSWANYARAVNKAARSLLALHSCSGNDRKNYDGSLRVGLLAKASPEYLVLHMACLSAGVVPVSLPLGCSSDQLGAILRHAETRYVFVDDPLQLSKLSRELTLDSLDGILLLERSDAAMSNSSEHAEGGAGQVEEVNDSSARDSSSSSKIIGWRDFLRRGNIVTQSTLDLHMRRIRSEQLASIVYPSSSTCAGTKPRGMMYSHENLLWTARRCAEAMQLNESDIHFSFLPISHITEQLLSLYCLILVGHRVFFRGESQATLLRDLQSVQPTRVAAPASFWKALHSSLHEQFAREVCLPPTILRATLARSAETSDDDDDDSLNDGAGKGSSGHGWKISRGKEKQEERQSAFTIGSRGEETAVTAASRARERKQKLGVEDLRRNPLLLHLFKRHMGLVRLRVGYSGFAPLPAKLIAFFAKLDITVCELYAHPYATGLVSCNRPPPAETPATSTTRDPRTDGGDDDDSEGDEERQGDEDDSEEEEEEGEEEEQEQTNKPGTVGLLVGDSEVELDESSVPQDDESNHGEILIKGRNVFMGFLNDDEATAEVFAREGWVRTGDVGTVDEDDMIKLKGRRDELFRLQSGELVFPWKTEKLLKASPLIEDALVLGDKRAHVAALLSLSSLSRSLSPHERMAAIKEAVMNANGKLADADMIKKIATISPSTKLAHHTQCTTPLGRVLRSALPSCFPKEMSALYPDDPDLAAAGAAAAATAPLLSPTAGPDDRRSRQGQGPDSQEISGESESEKEEAADEEDQEEKEAEEEEEEEREEPTALVLAREVEKNDGQVEEEEAHRRDLERKTPAADQEQISAGRVAAEAKLKEEEEEETVREEREGGVGKWMKGKEATTTATLGGGGGGGARSARSNKPGSNLTIGETRNAVSGPSPPVSSPAGTHSGQRPIIGAARPRPGDDRATNYSLGPCDGQPDPHHHHHSNESYDPVDKEKQALASSGRTEGTTDQEEGSGRQTKEVSVMDLSEGIIVYLFSFLAPSDLGSVALACRRFKIALDDEVLWKLLLQRTYGTGGLLVTQACSSSKLSKAVDWRNTFINRAKVWKAHAHEDAVELLALCAKWGAAPLLCRLLDDGYRRHHHHHHDSSSSSSGGGGGGDGGGGGGGGIHGGEAWVRNVINRKTCIRGKTVLHWACEYGNVRLVEYLVHAYGGWLDLNAKADIATVALWPQVGSGGGGGGGKTLHTPLSLASEGGHLDVLQFLLEQEGTRCGVETTLYCLIAAVTKEQQVVARFLLDRLRGLVENGHHEAPTREFVFRARLWALELACERSNLQLVRDIIAGGGIDLALSYADHRHHHNSEPSSSSELSPPPPPRHYHDAAVKCFHGLFRACENGSVKIVSALLDCGLPVNMRELPASTTSITTTTTTRKWTALHYAAKRGDLGLIQKLVARGADPSLTAWFDGRRVTPLAVAEAMGRDETVVRYLSNITPRSLLQRPEVVLSAAGAFVVVALSVIASQLAALLFP